MRDDSAQQDTSKKSKEYEFLKNITQAYKAAKPDNDYYIKTQEFLLQKSLTPDDVKNMQAEGLSTMTFPILSPILNRNLKNIMDSIPSPYVKPTSNNDLQADKRASVLTAKLSQVLSKSNYDAQAYSVSQCAMVGNMGVFAVKTDYENEEDFYQYLCVEAEEDPTMIVFDPNSRHPTGRDSEFVVKFKEMPEDYFKEAFPDVDMDELKHTVESGDVPWIKEKDGKRYYLVANYYYKKYTNERTIYQLENGEISKEKPAKKDIKAKRVLKDCSIRHCRMLAQIVLEPDMPTNFLSIPFVKLPGVSYITHEKKRRYLAYMHPAIDAQRTKNFMAAKFMDAVMNAAPATTWVPRGSMTEGEMSRLLDPKNRRVAEYKSYEMNESGVVTQLPPPTVTNPEMANPDLINMFNGLDQTVQTIMGQFNMDIGQETSGVALYNLGSMQHASVVMILHHIRLATEQVAKIILETLPFVAKPEQLAVNYDNKPQIAQENYDYEKHDFHVVVEAGINYKLQQQHTIEMMVKLAQESPTFAQYLDKIGVLYILKNMDLNNKVDIITSFESFMKQMAQQPAPPDPKLVDAQAHMMDAQNDQQDIQLRSAELQIKDRHQQQDLALRAQHGNMKGAIEMNKIKAGNRQADVKAAVDLHKERHASARHGASMENQTMQTLLQPPQNPGVNNV